MSNPTTHANAPLLEKALDDIRKAMREPFRMDSARVAKIRRILDSVDFVIANTTEPDPVSARKAMEDELIAGSSSLDPFDL